MQFLKLDFWRSALRDPVVVAGMMIDLAPIIAVMFGGWGAAALVMLYWVENLLVGVGTIPRILVSSVASGGRVGILFGLFVTIFFIVHYGMFCFGHGVFLFSFLPDIGTGSMMGAPGPGGVAKMVGAVLGRWPAMNLLLAMTAAYMAYVFVTEYIQRKGYEGGTPVKEMFMPYGRIVVLHIGIFAGAAALIAVGDPMIGVLALILLRAIFGVFSNAHERLRPVSVGSLPTR